MFPCSNPSLLTYSRPPKCHIMPKKKLKTKNPVNSIISDIPYGFLWIPMDSYFALTVGGN